VREREAREREIDTLSEPVVENNRMGVLDFVLLS
jgi:hypothetical protein